MLNNFPFFNFYINDIICFYFSYNLAVCPCFGLSKLNYAQVGDFRVKLVRVDRFYFLLSIRIMSESATSYMVSGITAIEVGLIFVK